MRNRRHQTTTFDGTYLHYKRPYCDALPKDELADPTRNSTPFQFSPRCGGCNTPIEPDWGVINAAQSSFSTKPNP